MKDRNRLLKLCVDALQFKGFTGAKYKERLKQEIKEIDIQAEHEYFLNLHHFKSFNGFDLAMLVKNVDQSDNPFL